MATLLRWCWQNVSQTISSSGGLSQRMGEFSFKNLYLYIWNRCCKLNTMLCLYFKERVKINPHYTKLPISSYMYICTCGAFVQLSNFCENAYIKSILSSSIHLWLSYALIVHLRNIRSLCRLQRIYQNKQELSVVYQWYPNTFLNSIDSGFIT